ncbi:MAG: hypothetical protein QXU32_12590 [Nitrososphaerales archaeon]
MFLHNFRNSPFEEETVILKLAGKLRAKGRGMETKKNLERYNCMKASNARSNTKECYVERISYMVREGSDQCEWKGSS